MIPLVIQDEFIIKGVLRCPLSLLPNSHTIGCSRYSLLAWIGTFLWHALEGFYPNRIRVIPKRKRFPSQRPSRNSSHAHGDGLPQLPALPLLPLPPGNLFTNPQRQRPTPHGRRLTTYSDCDQALRYECVDRGSVMGPTDARYGPSGQRLSAAVSSSNDILPGKACSPLGQVTVGLLPGTLATAGQRTPQGAPVRYTG